MFLSETNVNEIIKIVRNLAENTYSDCNDMNMSFVKNIIHLLVQPFTYICNLSFATGIFLDAMKIARVIPIHKIGAKDEFNNYRPFSTILSNSCGYFMIDWINLSVEMICYQTANLVSELADLLALQLLI